MLDAGYWIRIRLRRRGAAVLIGAAAFSKRVCGPNGDGLIRILTLVRRSIILPRDDERKFVAARWVLPNDTMKTMVEFRSKKFPPNEGEEEQINPWIMGQAACGVFSAKIG